MPLPSSRLSAFHLSSIMAASIAVDQLTKVLAQAHLRGQAPRIYLGDVFRFEYAENPGAFLSLGSAIPEELRFWILTIGVAALLFAGLIYLVRARSLEWVTQICLALLIGGGLSNLIDRLFRPGGRVVDFMNMGIGSLRTGIFNVADMLIMAGVIVLAFPGLVGQKPHRK